MSFASCLRSLIFSFIFDRILFFSVHFLDIIPKFENRAAFVQTILESLHNFSK